MRIHVSHLTRYAYDQAVRFLPHMLYLRPREGPLLQMQRFSYAVSPAAAVHWQRDDYDNFCASAHPLQAAPGLEIRTDFEVLTLDAAPLQFTVRDYAAHFPFAYEPLHQFNLTPYLAPPSAETQSRLHGWLDRHYANRPRDVVPFLFGLLETLRRTLRNVRREEPGIQPSLQTITSGAGSCRDHAVLLIEIARTLGLAARFVSGYYFDPAISPAAPGAMHAWAEVYLPGAGWKGVDPTSGLFCHDAYVPVAHAAVAESVNPVQGSYVASPAARTGLWTLIVIERLG